MASGKLNPHTLIICDEYVAGPEYRFLEEDALGRDEKSEIVSKMQEDSMIDCKSNLACLDEITPHEKQETNLQMCVQSSKLFSTFGKLSSLKKSQIQPFAVRVCPDAAFLTDLHAHLSDSEIIGLLGGRYISSERCIYIQAAFPCKSTVRSDAGFTDVEMDPVSQIIAGDAIVRHGMTVVGWYHSHPRFQPDPSVTDIENQGNYQNLFQSAFKAHRSTSGSSTNCDDCSSTSSDSNEETTETGLARSNSDNTNTDVSGGVPSTFEEIKSDKTCKTTEKDDDVCPFVGLIVGTYDGKKIAIFAIFLSFSLNTAEYLIAILFFVHRPKSNQPICYALVSCN